MDNKPTLAEYIARQAGVPGASCPNLPNTYIGMRYVPEFADPVEWDATMKTEYEYLKIVTWQGNSYTSRTWVPKNIPITNTDYWILTGNYNAQVEAYRKEVQAFDGRITAVENEYNELEPMVRNNSLSITEMKQYFVDIRDFGASVSNDDNTSQIQAAINEATAEKRILFIPPGIFKVNSQPTSFTGLCKCYSAGSIQVNNKQWWLTGISSRGNTFTSNYDDTVEFIFNADAPETGYTENHKGAVFFVNSQTRGGHNESTTGNEGRTGTAAVYLKNSHYGQGDGNVVHLTGVAASAGSDEQSWLSDPATILANGDVFGASNNHYLNLFEFNARDNGGKNNSAIGWVMNLIRSATAPTKQTYWVGHLIQSTGGGRPDAAYSAVSSPSGAYYAVYDASRSPSTEAALVLTAGQKIIFNNVASEGPSKYNPDVNSIVLDAATRQVAFREYSSSTPVFTVGTSFIAAKQSMSTYTIYPSESNTYDLGSAIRKWRNIYSESGTLTTSDEREKTDIEDIPDTVLNAWEEVNFNSFKFKKSVEEKGSRARTHFGVIAQNIIAIFEKHGLDAFEYGIVGYDEWEDITETESIVESPAEYGDKGKLLKEAQITEKEKIVTQAGSRYSVRYEECMILEMACLRRKLKLL